MKELEEKKVKGSLFVTVEIIAGIASILAVLLAFFFLTRFVIGGNTMTVDVSIATYVYSLRAPLLTTIMLFITQLGNYPSMTVITMAILLILWKKHKRESLTLIITVVMGYILNLFLKFLIQRPRPLIQPVMQEAFYSFPSGHAMNSFVFYIVIAYFSSYITSNRILSYVIRSICVILILLIGFSRIYLGVHYPSDIIGGYLAGFVWFGIVLLVSKTIGYYRLHRTG